MGDPFTLFDAVCNCDKGQVLERAVKTLAVSLKKKGYSVSDIIILTEMESLRPLLQERLSGAQHRRSTIGLGSPVILNLNVANQVGGNMPKYNIKAGSIGAVGDNSSNTNNMDTRNLEIVTFAESYLNNIRDEADRKRISDNLKSGAETGDWNKTIDNIDKITTSAEKIVDVGGTIWSGWPIIREYIRMKTGI